MIEMGRNKKTANVILNYVNNEKLQIAITSFDDFNNLLGKYPEIENIYLMGHSWNKCIHTRPIGLWQCLCINKNVIINQKCVWNVDTVSTLQIEKDQVFERYVKLKDNIYQIFSNNPAIDS
jgi:hypothetical protein